MIITKRATEKITIHEEGLDPVNVFVEDFQPEQGRILVECCGDSWSYYWNRMGSDTPTVKEFVVKAGSDYLAKKLAPFVRPTVVNESKISEYARNHIIELRKTGER